jgi:hypothetical protein
MSEVEIGEEWGRLGKLFFVFGEKMVKNESILTNTR